jgi:hypothetical protein
MADDQFDAPQAPFLPDLAGAMVAELLKDSNLERLRKHQQNSALEQAKDTTEFVAGGFGWLFEKFAELILDAINAPGPFYNALGRVAVDSLLNEGDGSVSPPADAGQRLINRVAGTPGQIQPGIDGAARYLSLMLTEEIEAWVRGVVSEMVTEIAPRLSPLGGGMETVSKLEDVISTMLGGPRLVRRVLQPFIQATAITPAQWHVNKQYRPELLSVADTVRQFLRGRWTAEQMQEELARQGWSADRIEALVNGQRKVFSVADVRQFVTREHWTQDQGRQHLQDQGYTEPEAMDALRLEGLKRFEQLEAEEARAIIGSYVAGDITRSEMQTFMSTAVQNATERNLFLELAELRAGLSRKFLSIADERRLAIAGIRVPADFRRALEREGYVPEAVAALELELRAEIADRRADAELRAEQAAERAAEKQRADEERAARVAAIAAEKALPSVAEVRRAFVRGHVAIDRYSQAVQAAHPGITGEDLAALLADAELDRAAVLEAEEKRAAAAAKEADAALPLGALEDAVFKGILSIEDYARDLQGRGYDEREINVLVALLKAEQEDRAVAATKRAEAERKAAARGVSLDAFERAVRLGVRTLDQYAAYLATLDLSELARALILDVLRAQLAQDAAARANREASAAAAARKGISLERRRRAVLLGILTPDDYARALVNAGLPVDDQRVELALLDAELADALAVRARRDEIAAELEARRQREEADRAAREAEVPPPPPITELTLSQVERAVKLNLLPPDALREHAIAKGYSPDDAELLVELALFAVPDLRDGERRREEIKTELAAKQVSLDDLERLVLRGIRDLTFYEGELRGRGYGDDDVALLRQLLEERVGVDVDNLRKKLTAAIEKADGVPPLAAIDDALLIGTITADEARATLESAGVARDTALVYVRLLITTAFGG